MSTRRRTFFDRAARILAPGIVACTTILVLHPAPAVSGPPESGPGGSGGADPTRLHDVDLLIGPVAGLTTQWHEAPKGSLIPCPALLEFRTVVPPDEAAAQIEWVGATEVERDGNVSTAIYLVTEAGEIQLGVDVTFGDGARVEERVTYRGVEINTGDIRVNGVTPSVAPFELDAAATNIETMRAYFGESIAPFVDLGNGLYRTSVDRRIQFVVDVEPAGFAPLVEWRIDDRVVGIGRHATWAFSQPGLHPIDAGRDLTAPRVVVETYDVAITTSPRVVEHIDDGERVRVEAHTIPRGYEDEIRWLSSTKYGHARPVVGSGPVFDVVFDETWGQGADGIPHQWLGVKANNATLGQDQKCQPQELAGWNDVVQGGWTDTTPTSFADLDGDRDVDADDRAILLDEFTGADTPHPGATDGDGFFQPVPFDFDADGDVDDDDLFALDAAFTGPLSATDFNFAGLGATDPLTYDVDADEFVVDGIRQDTVNPDVQWQYVGFGAPLAYLNRRTLPAPAPVVDPDVQAAMSDHGFTPEEIAQIQDLAGDRLVTDVTESFVDLTQETFGEVNVLCDGESVPFEGTINFGLRISTILFEDGSFLTTIVEYVCPSCWVAIINCPPCVCEGCDYTFCALGWWPLGEFSWEVTEGADKTDPDTGEGFCFTTNFVEKSDAKRDITVRVTYTSPNGDTCSRECKTTSVALTVNRTAPATIHVTDAAGNPDITGGNFRHGGPGGDTHGIRATVSDISITTDPDCDECCESIKVGFLQNITENSIQYTYDGGGTVAWNADVPILDAAGAGNIANGADPPPYYPFPRGSSSRCGEDCGDDFDLSIGDTPGHSWPVAYNGQNLSSFARHMEFRTWLVAECPKGSRNFKCLHEWDWELDYTATIVDGAITASTATSTSSRGDCSNFGTAITTGPVFNDSQTFREAGFDGDD